mgnify:CR=1 FL=1
MKAQDNIKHDEITPQADPLRDLPVTEDQANQTKAGASAPIGKLYVGTNVGVY